MSGMRTPLSRVRGLGSAREGTGHFWHQRLTAIANVPLTLFFVGFVVAHAGSTFAETRGALANPFVAAALLLFLISALAHMRIGMQVIIEDYVHGELAKVAMVALNTFFSAAVGLASAVALLKIAFGG